MAKHWKLVPRPWKAMAAAAAIALAVIVPMQLAGAAETEDPQNPAAGFTIPQGTITLKMKPDATNPNGNSYFRFVAPDGTTENWVQKFKQSGKCAYTPTTTPTRVEVTANSTNSVGYLEKDNGWGLGINSGGAASSCTQVNAGETMTLNFRPGLDPNQYLDYAELDMELKYSTTVLNIKLYKGAALVYSYTRNCTTSDCGPDSGGNDNFRVRVPIGTGTVLFDKMELSVTNTGSQGAATLEGGSDLGTSPSTFDVVTPATPITCNEEITDPSDPSGGTDATITFVTLTQTSGCPTGKGYLLNTTTHKIELITGGSSEMIRTVVQAVWAPQSTQSPVPVSIVSPCVAGTPTCNTSTNEEPEQWCDGEFNPADAPTLQNPDGTWGASMPAGHVWCRITQSTQIVDPVNDLMQITELSLLEGDAFKRN